MFMATSTTIKFSEDIKGFHFYDSDYSNKIAAAGYSIKIIPHLVFHDSQVKNLADVDSTFYNKKWEIKLHGS